MPEPKRSQEVQRLKETWFVMISSRVTQRHPGATPQWKPWKCVGSFPDQASALLFARQKVAREGVLVRLASAHANVRARIETEMVPIETGEVG